MIKRISYKLFDCSKHSLLLVAFIACVLFSSAQKLTVSANKIKVEIGEPVEVTYQLNDFDSKLYDIKYWENLSDTFNHLELLQTSKTDTLSSNQLFKIVQKYQVTGFEAGNWQIPSIKITIENKQTKVVDTVKTIDLPLQVIAADASALKDFNDIKPIEEVKANTNWLLISIIIIAVLILAIVVVVILRKRKPIVKPVVIDNNTLLKALQAIDALVSKQLIQQQQHKQFYVELIDICRQFSDTVLHQQTKSATTDEYMLQVKGWVGAETMQTKYFQLLRLADVVKFAKYIPNDALSENAITTAKELVNTLFHYNQKRA